ncbi:MAG: hypothetical protein QHH26_07135 [Armatimonadota bacterium]|nr:hypothetical protein [Armatimonadota bacterium]
MTERDLEQQERAAELEGRCIIDMDTAREQATWYSVVNTIALCLGSGMGIPLNESDAQNIFDMIGVSPDNLPLKNPQLLKAFWKSGDPHLMRDFSERDLGTWRWNPDSFDRTLVPQAQGWPIIAECECAKWFAVPQEAEVLPADFRNEWRINGLLLATIARLQCNFAFENLRNNRGLFAMQAQPGSVQITDANANLEDQACMLWACSDVAMLAAGEGANAIYKSPDVNRKFINLANELFEAIDANKDSLLENSSNPILGQSVAIEALIWFACTSDAQDLRARSLWMLREFADNLVRAQEKSEMVGNTLIDACSALRALIEAFRVTRVKTYAQTAAKIFDYVESQWWQAPAETYAPSPFASEYTFNADDVGQILGALNETRLFLRARANSRLAELRLREFFCNVVNLSGFQMSMPSTNFMPQWLRDREPSEHFRSGSIPLPSQANGEHGIAPVMAGEIGYDVQSDTWSRRMIFDTPAAMHTCCEMIWINCNVVNGFPEIRLEEAPLAVRQAAGVEAT